MPSQDERFMRLALRLAAKAQGRTRPNPMVGAVVVRSGKILGRGFHSAAGGPHAEVIALRQAGRFANGSVLYVSLEPCAHVGRTPACTEAIRTAGIRRVVAAMIDPNPRTRGRGLKQLKSRGIQTKVGVLEEEARALNEIFVTWMKKKRPFVTVKVAQSLDGKIATRTGKSKWISGPKARRWARHLRSQADAILVGVETILKDDPLLTVTVGPKAPLRVILDSSLRTPSTARLLTHPAPVLIACTRAGSIRRELALRRAGAEILRFSSQNGRVPLASLLSRLARREVSHLLIEGGGETIASALVARAVDRICCVMAPLIIGGKEAPTAAEGEGFASLAQAVRLKDFFVSRLGSDLLIQADVR